MIACHSRVHGLSCDHAPGARRQAHAKVNPTCDCPLTHATKPYTVASQLGLDTTPETSPCFTAGLECRLSGQPDALHLHHTYQILDSNHLEKLPK
jgi:hypothetical protein